MKLVTFLAADGVERVGALVESDRVVALQDAYADRLLRSGAEWPQARAVARSLFSDMVQMINLGEWGKREARAAMDHAVGTGDDSGLTYSLADVRLCPPLRPVALRDCIAFEDHIRNSFVNLSGREVPAEFYKIPVYYKGNPTTVFGPDDDIHWPSYSELWDYELELGIVIGSSGVDVSREEAESHIYGLTIFNDFSARDILKDELAVGLGPAKSKDFATGIGPWLVTMDEIPDIYDLDMEARVNGEVWSTGHTGIIHWKFDEIIHRMSQSEPLRSGEIFGSGTVANGCGLELGKYLQQGDVVELEISGLGVLRNRVVGESTEPTRDVARAGHNDVNR